jgi:cystathionine beta-lyase
MEYDFSEAINREGTSAIKQDMLSKLFGNEKAIPMWVADMDFATPKFIIDRLKQRLEHPILGYTYPDSDYHSAITNWMEKRHQWKINPSWISFAPGIVAGLNHAVQAFTSVGDKILVQTPVYHPFFYAVNNNRRQVVSNPLVYSENGYTINFQSFEKAIKNGVKLFILCNPHNPVGRVWQREELKTMAEICISNGVTIIADEIHADLIFYPHKHIPLASLSSEIASKTVTFGSASKSFNIAGLTSAYAIIESNSLLEAYHKQLERNGTGHGNIMGYEAVKAAYSPEGEDWLKQALAYIYGNVKLVKEFFEMYVPGVKVVIPEGTYLAWLNFNSLGFEHDELKQKIFIDAGVALNDGQIFGPEGVGFFRMNLATPRSNVEMALERLKRVFG